MQETLSEFFKGFSQQLSMFKGISVLVALLLTDICMMVIFLKCYSEKKFCLKKWRKRFGYIAVVDDTRVIPVENSEILLGRHRSADIQFPDLSVSRYHAVLTYSDGIFLLDDLNSKSGTYVNGKRIKSAVVKVNDEIQLGSMTFHLKKIKDVENDKRKNKA